MALCDCRCYKLRWLFWPYKCRTKSPAQAIENVSRVCIAWYKHERSWENSRQLCKAETKSKVCITVENSPNPSRVYTDQVKQTQEESFLLLLYNKFREKNAKLFVMALIKREILTSRKVLHSKSVLALQKVRKNVSLREKKLTQLVCIHFPSFSRMNG